MSVPEAFAYPLPPGGRLGLYGFGSSAHIAAQLAMSVGAQVYAISILPGQWASPSWATRMQNRPRSWIPPSPVTGRNRTSELTLDSQRES